MSKHLEVAMKGLKTKVLELTTIVEMTVKKAVTSLETKDEELAREVVKTDRIVDELEVELEEDCLKILALHQPVAIDLRYIVGVLKVNNDLERIADLSVNIAERAIRLMGMREITPPFNFTDMAEKTYSMLKRSIDSLIEMDTVMAKKVCTDDSEVDAINRAMYKTVYKKIDENPKDAEILIQYLSTSKHLERIADYTTNIAEDVIYMVDGTIVRHGVDQGTIAKP